MSQPESVKGGASSGTQGGNSEAVQNDTVHMSEYYKAVIGTKEQAYYLNQFAKFDKQGKGGPTWHWPAFFATFYWLLYRKMFPLAFGYGALFIVLFILFFDGDPYVPDISAVIYAVVSLLIIPMYADAIYYNYCRRRIARMRAVSPDVKKQLAFLAMQSGTNTAGVIAAMIMVAATAIGIWSLIALLLGAIPRG